MATSTQINAITALYVGYFDRAPDPAGLQFWIDQLDNGREYNTIAADFAASPEAVALYPYLTTPDVSSPASFVTNIYANLFGRTPDQEGLDFWTGVLEDGSVSVADMIEAIIMGARDDAAAGTFDKSVLDNKVEVGLDFATSAAEVPGFEFDAAAKAAAVAAVNGVTEDEATVEAAKAATDAFVAGDNNPGAGDTFTLTAAVGEAIEGTAGNDTFRAVVDDEQAKGTLNTADVIDGKAGQDTANLIFTDQDGGGEAAALPAGNAFNNVEIINLNVTAAGAAFAAPINDSAFADVEQLWQIDNTSGGGAGKFANVTGLSAGVTAGLRSDGSATADTATVTLTSGATEKTANAAVDGIGSGSVITFAGAGLETLNVSGSMRDGTVLGVVDAGQEETVNISLSGNVEVNSTGVAAAVSGLTTAKTIDLSGSTGNITMNVTDAAALTTLKGGSGSDMLMVDLEDGNAVTVDLGAGNDTLMVNGSGAAANKASTITLGAGSDTLDLNVISNIADADKDEFEAGIITVSDFNTSSDVLDVASLTNENVADNTLQANISAAADLFAAIGVAAAGSTDAVVFEYGADLYVYNDAGNNGLSVGDGLVKITGVQADELTATNFLTS